MKFIRKKGFTLIEVIVVIAIVAILFGYGMPVFRQAIANAEKEIRVGKQRYDWQMSEMLLRNEIQNAFAVFSTAAFSYRPCYHANDQQHHEILPIVLFFREKENPESPGQMRYVIYDISGNKLTRKVWTTKKFYLSSIIRKGQLSPGYFLGSNVILDGVRHCEYKMNGSLLYLKLEGEGQNVVEWIIRIPQWIPLTEG